MSGNARTDTHPRLPVPPQCRRRRRATEMEDAPGLECHRLRTRCTTVSNVSRIRGSDTARVPRFGRVGSRERENPDFRFPIAWLYPTSKCSCPDQAVREHAYGFAHSHPDASLPALSRLHMVAVRPASGPWRDAKPLPGHAPQLFDSPAAAVWEFRMMCY